MVRYIGPRCRLCRREGVKLFLKGEKCDGPKCPLTKRDYGPGQHGAKIQRGRLSNYGLQLREKQKVKRIYGVVEKQFRRYFRIAERSKDITGKVLLQLLERRLDNVVYRCGFALSRAEARQIARHNFVYVNGRRVNIPSYLIDKDDIVEIKGDERRLNKIKKTKERSSGHIIPSWLQVENLKAKVLRLPEKEDLQFPIQEQLIVELYSK